MASNRRQVKNVIVDGRALLRLSAPFMVMLVASLGLVLTVYWQLLGAIVDVGPLEPATTATLLHLSSTIQTTLVFGMPLLGCICFILWVVASHRIFGPVVPIRRQIENLGNGIYDQPVNLRKHDELKAIAADLNRLAEILRQQKS